MNSKVPNRAELHSFPELSKWVLAHTPRRSKPLHYWCWNSGRGCLQCWVTQGRPAKGPRTCGLCVRPSKDTKQWEENFQIILTISPINQRIIYKWKITSLHSLLLTLWFHIMFVFNCMEGVGVKGRFWVLAPSSFPYS